MFDVEGILNNANLKDLVQKAGGQVDKNGRCPCPLHGGDNDTGFSVFQKDGRDYWKCWTHDCGQGDAIDFVRVWQGLDFKGACAFLGGDVASDPVAMEASAKARLEQAKIDHEEARLKMEARRAELQVAQLHLHYHETMQEWGRLEWVRRGIDEGYQGLWMLGSCDDKKLIYKGEEYHTPTITIPLVDSSYTLLNIKHRLINPPKPNDKYRPEREGLGAFPPFIAFPDVGYNADTIWIMEGEIKAMVTATISPDAGWQFVGVPGQDAYDKLPAELFKGKSVIVVPDPQAERKAWNFAKRIGAKFLMTPDKIDDMIVEYGYNGDWLAAMGKQARLAKG
jgi:hypothetical protein